MGFILTHMDSMCACGKLVDLWVESLEHMNYWNPIIHYTCSWHSTVNQRKDKRKERKPLDLLILLWVCNKKQRFLFCIFFYFPEERQENWQGNSSVMETISRPPSCLITGSIFGILQQAPWDTILWTATVLHCNKNKNKNTYTIANKQARAF